MGDADVPAEVARIDRGVVLALLAAVLFGASAAFAKLLLRDTSPQLLAGLLCFRASRPA